jgi:predicted peroxiredoxin
MRKTLLALALLGTAATAPALPAVAHGDVPRLLTVIATGEPQTQLMALILTQASLQKGAEVRIMLCGPGGDMALNEAPASAVEPLAPRGLSPQGLLTRLIEAKVPVAVCAIYLPNKGLARDALIEGVGVAMPPEVADYMLDENVRLLTF